MKPKRQLAAALLLIASVGCASPRNYWSNLGSDALDTIRVHAMFGPGAGAKLDVTRLMQFGLLGAYRVFAAGVSDDEVGVWSETVFSWGLLVGAHYEVDMRGTERVSGSYGWFFDDAEGQPLSFKPSDSGEVDLDLYTLRGTAMLVVGLDLEIRLGEIYDFFAGIFGFDPAGDYIDYDAIEKDAYQQDQKAKTAGGDAAGSDAS